LPENGEQSGDEITQQLVEQFGVDIFSIPWGHQIRIIDKFKDNQKIALFYVRKVIEEGWSRDMLLNFISTDLYSREGKAQSNFKTTLPSENSDLAQELTKDPYNFAFAGITGKYNEKRLKDALLNNLTNFLLELGTGFAYIGKTTRWHSMLWKALICLLPFRSMICNAFILRKWKVQFPLLQKLKEPWSSLAGLIVAQTQKHQTANDQIISTYQHQKRRNPQPAERLCPSGPDWDNMQKPPRRIFKWRFDESLSYPEKS